LIGGWLANEFGKNCKKWLRILEARVNDGFEFTYFETDESVKMVRQAYSYAPPPPRPMARRQGFGAQAPRPASRSFTRRLGADSSALCV